MFSALRQGSSIYVLEKDEKPIVKIGKVESITSPRPQYNSYNPNISFSENMQTLVNITVRFSNKPEDKKEYIGIPSNLSTHTYGDIIISESRDAMIAEIDGLLQSSKSIIESIDYHKQMITECENILKQLSPAYAKETERDGAIDKLNDEVSLLRDQITKMTELLTKAGNTQIQLL